MLSEMKRGRMTRRNLLYMNRWMDGLVEEMLVADKKWVDIDT